MPRRSQRDLWIQRGKLAIEYEWQYTIYRIKVALITYPTIFVVAMIGVGFGSLTSGITHSPGAWIGFWGAAFGFLGFGIAIYVSHKVIKYEPPDQTLPSQNNEET